MDAKNIVAEGVEEYQTRGVEMRPKKVCRRKLVEIGNAVTHGEGEVSFATVDM